MSARKTNKNTVLLQSLKSVSSKKQLPDNGNEKRVSPFTDFSHVVDYLPQGIRIVGIDYIVQSVNRAFAELSGVSPEEVIGKKCWEVFPSPFCHTDECRLKQILKGKQMVQAELERQKKDGSTVPCMVSAFPLKDKTGKLIGVLESFRDITEKKQLQAQVEETEDRYRALIELGTEAGEAIVMLQDIDGKEGIQTYVSDQWPRITGFSREELQGMPFLDLIDPLDREASLLRHRRKISGESVPGLFEMTLICKDGSKLPIEITGSYTRYRGKNANVIYIRNISERKELEKALADERDKYRSLFDDAPITLWEMDYSDIKKYLNQLRSQGVVDFHEYFLNYPDQFINAVRLSKFIRYNRAHLELWEAQDIPKADLHQREKEVFYKYPENFVALRDDYARLANGEMTFTKEETIRTLKENVKHILTKFTVAPGHEENWHRVFASLTDITQRKNVELELKQYKDKLEELVNERTIQLRQEIEQRKVAEAKLQQSLNMEASLRKEAEKQMEQRILFTRALAHELKTPLTPLLAASEYLSSNLAGIQKEFADAVSRGSRRLEHRVNEFLDLSKGELGLLETKCQKTKLYDILDGVLADLKPYAESHDQSLELTVSKRLPFVLVDRNRLEQVLLNLIENAIKFNRKNGKVLIKARRNRQEVVVSVSDEGYGIDKKTMQVLFEPYKRPSSQSGWGGLGLGLALSKMLIELQGGRIWAKSQKNRGTMVSFAIQLYSKITEVIAVNENSSHRRRC